MIRYYLILLVKGTLIYRIAEDLDNVVELIDDDAYLLEVMPIGFCNSNDWFIEWLVDDEIRASLSGAVLELINDIRITNLE